jgi:hypothetical protein
LLPPYFGESPSTESSMLLRKVYSFTP